MRRLLPSVLVPVALLSLLAISVEAADASKKIQVLLLTGDDVPSHNWKEASTATYDVLAATGRFDVRVCEEPMILDSAAALARYDVIMLVFYNKNLPTITDQAKQNLLGFVKAGKGLVVQHLASASFAEWPEFKQLCGRYWLMKTSGHGPRSVFDVRVTGKDHPITKGLDNFQTDDELYAKLQGDAPIQVLAEASSDWSNRVEPLVFVLNYGQGRVLHHCFGHDRKAVMIPNVQKIIARGTEWAATGKVAD
jgi:type 1 glutamine amidotransferase